MQSRHITAMIFALLSSSSLLAAGVVTICDEANLTTALQGGGTVEFACSGTIPITQTIYITQPTTLRGNFLGVTISAGNARRHFLVNYGASLLVEGVTLTGGYSSEGGGAIRSQGDVIIRYARLTANKSVIDGGAIHMDGGSLLVENSELSNNRINGASGSIAMYAGGAIYSNYSNVTVTHSTFKNNFSGCLYQWGTPAPAYGGAICVSNGSLTMLGSFLSANWAHGCGPQSNPSYIGQPSYGGAIAILGNNASIADSTLYDNKAEGEDNRETGWAPGPGYGGAIHVESGASVSLNNLTLMQNQAICGLYSMDPSGNFPYCDPTYQIRSDSGAISGVSSIHNLILWNNSAYTGKQCAVTQTDLGGGYGSLPGAGYCASAATQLSTAPGIPTDNGGPNWTAAIAGGANSINTGGTGCSPQDQRGARRFNFCDIGAFEYNSLPVGPPVIAASVAPVTACSGADTTLTVTLRNDNLNPLTRAGFGLLLSVGVTVSGTPLANAGCAGFLSLVAPAQNVVAMRDATIYAGQTCTVTIPVRAGLAGSYNITTSQAYALESAPSATGASTSFTAGQSPDDLGNGNRVGKLGASLLLQWQPVLNADSYNIYQDTAAGGPFTTLTTSVSGGSSSGAVIASPAGSMFYRIAGYKAPCLGPK